MGTSAWSDLRSLLRTVRLGRAAPRIIAGAERKAAEFKQAFDRTVRPILDESVDDHGLRAQMTESMLSYATKSAFVVDGYAQMAGVSFDGDIAMLGLSFTRLYDDLLDKVDDRNLMRRVGELFQDGRFTPTSDLELLLDRLYRELDRRLGRSRDDPYYAAAITAHNYQVRSTCQRDPQTSHSTLVEITRGKGAYGTLTVFALMQPGLCPRECQLIMEVGEALQMLDDWVDVSEDRRNGIRTTATEGQLHLADIGQRLRTARPKLVSYYGHQGAREFLAVCYLTMWLGFLGRRWPRPGTSARPGVTAQPDHRPASRRHQAMARGTSKPPTGFRGLAATLSARRHESAEV